MVHTYSGYEHKVKAALEERIRGLNKPDLFGEILVPSEKVVEIVKGKKQTSSRKFFAGYILVNMRLKAGGVHELHWHKPAEWAFMLKGRARITAIDQDGHAFQDDVGEGDLWNFPSVIPQSIQGLGRDGCDPCRRAGPDGRR